MESQNFEHEHPLVFTEEWSNQNAAACCSRCGEVMMSGPCFVCAAECGFYSHKQCEEAPSQINHPFHQLHPFSLLPKPPYKSITFICNFCGERGKNFVYHCSCNIDLHIKCAFFTFKIAEKNFEEFKGIDCIDPTVATSTENEENQKLETAKCFGCCEPLLNSVYYSLDCGFHLHKKCVELPFEINYPCHKQHPLILQFTLPNPPCIICPPNANDEGLCYYCSTCNFGIHVACFPPPPTIEDENHQHLFTLFFRHMSFTCDACGIKGKGVPYMCSNCGLLVHKSCISLPRIIKFMWHEHPIFHKYSLESHEFKNLECVICLNEVKMKYGSYSCSDCRFIVHVNCVIKEYWMYYIVKPNEVDDYWRLLSDPSINSFSVVEQDENGKTTKMKHISHQHSLISSDKMVDDDDKYCRGCTLSISDSFYYCSKCNFCLHKICAELPMKIHFWRHKCQNLLLLLTNHIFRCTSCDYFSNGFCYNCDDCDMSVCIRCATPLTIPCQGHEHPIPHDRKYEGHCKACGSQITYSDYAFNCRRCNFALDWNCIRLPTKVRHKCDEHILTLTYHESNSYLEYHFCDICEEDRNPSHWFYYCPLCDTCAHPKCVLGKYPFINLENDNSYRFKDKHEHAISLVKKKYYYPQCSECKNPCQGLAAECVDLGCKLIFHWDCFARPGFRE